jgi:uncharacterized protein YkwD
MRKTLLAAGAVLTLALAGPWPSRAAHAVGPGATDLPLCSRSHTVPNRANVPRVRAALLCLINAERARHSRPALRVVRLLRTAAIRHSADMVRRRYFSHVTPAGATVAQRLRRLGRTRGRSSENIAWSSNGHNTPLSVFDAWMRSAPHRANVLSARWAEIGIGVVVGAPTRLAPTDVAATYTLVFAGR